MKNLNKLFTSAFCLVSLTAGLVRADNTSVTNGWSEWKHDDHVLPELYLRSRCAWDPADPKKAIWEIQFKDVGDALVEVKGKDFKYDIPAHDESAGVARVATKSCSKMPEVKMDGGVPVKGYAYKLTFKDGTLTVKPHDHHKVDWGGWITAGMMGAAAATNTMAENNAKMAEIRAQQQAQQQAAAQARALQLAQLQAAQQQAQAAAAERAAAQQQAQAAAAEQAAAQRLANEAAQLQAQRAAQAGQNRSSNSNGGNSGYAPAPRSSTPQPQLSDLSVSGNYVDSCNDGQALAHYQFSNGSYSNAQMTVEFDYQTGGLSYSFTVTRNLGPRSVNDYTRWIPCGGSPQLSDYGHSTIQASQFF